MHQVFPKDLELGHQMCAQILGDTRRTFVAPSEQEEIPPVLREERIVRRVLGRGRGTNRGRFLIQGHLYPARR